MYHIRKKFLYFIFFFACCIPLEPGFLLVIEDGQDLTVLVDANLLV